ncbi:MAG: fibronectin type III domain-containing protein [Thaumarchaeota archaeon]|nr:fibronectin type III domain-containing protein [Nitrososphaerota archaeon]
MVSMRESALILRLFVIIAVLFSPIGNEIYAAAQLSGIINTTNSTLSGLTNTTDGLLSGITNTTNSTLSGLTNTTNSTVSSLSNSTDTLLFNNGTLITTVNGIVMKFQMDPSEPLQTTTSTVAYVLPQDVKTGDPKSAVTLEDPQAISGTVSSAPYRFTIPNFNSGTGSNNLLLVGVSANNANVASVTFGSAQLTKAVSSFQNNDAEFWYLVNPTGTNNIVVTLSGPASAVVGAYVFSGVNQASPIAGTAANYNPAGTPSSPTVSITTKYSNDMVIDLPSIFGGQLLGSPTCAQQWNANVPSEITGASSTTTVSSPGTVTCGWTANNGGDQWDDVAIEVRASGTTTATDPSAPTSLVAAGGDAQISLSWSAPSSDGGSAITGYNIYRGTASGGETKYSSVSSSQTAYNDTSVTNGIKYYYEVTAVNAVGESARSGEASATPQTDATAPPAPTGLTANPGNETVSLSWTAPSSNGGSAITGYDIYRGTASGGETKYASVPASQTSYADTSATNGIKYYYEVTAVNSVGTSPASNEVGATPATSPQPPTGLAATASSSSQINLSWTAPSSNGGSAITGYKVGRSTDGTNWSTIAPNTGSASTSYSDAGLAATTTYYYRVSAINSVGTSQPSSVVNVKTQGPTYSINQTKSGLVASDSLKNETESQNQLLSNGGYWRYMGDAQQEGAPYSVSRDSQGLHMGVAAPSDGKWAGFFAVSPNHNAQVWNAVISTPVRTTPSNYYDNGIYVQTSDGNINYVTCGSLTNSQATIWVVISTVGNTQQVTQFNKLWVDNSPNQPLTRDCTIITNGNNYLKVYLDGTLVYQNSSMSLQMPMPFNAYLEEETSYGGQMLTDTFQNYYVTTSEYVTLNDLPSGTRSVAIDDSSGAVLATSPDDSGTSTLDVGQYPYPISGTLKVYDSNSQMATRSGTIYGGDAYSVN